MKDQELIKKLKLKLEEISSTLCDSIDKFDNPGVLAGVSGLALFMFYYYRFTNDHKFEKIGKKSLKKAVDLINDGCELHTFCSGISGLAWTCEHLERNGFIERNDISFLDDIDVYLLSCMEKEFENNNYDYLHGGLGIGYYFLSKKVRATKEDKLLYFLLKDKAIICEDDCLKWESMSSALKSNIINISLSHGMSSIIVVLTKLINNYPHIAEINEMLINTIRYILKQQTPQLKISYFPMYSLNSDLTSQQSRLGWCYGDLGIAQAILQAARILGNVDHENIAIKILLHCCNRKDMKENFVIDAGLCHGTSGISHIFNRLYKNTKNEEFENTSDYWMKKTLEMAKFSDGLAGFKSWQGEKGGWENQYILLEGISGIGLSIISKLNTELMNWDECMLLS